MEFSSLNVKSPLFLAPMAGYTDVVFRKIARSFGASLTFSELLSVNAICHRNKKTFEMMERGENEFPFAIQLFGSDPNLFLNASLQVEPLCDTININAGCPAPKVVKEKAGSYLLEDTKRLFSIIDIVKKNTKKPLGVKVRKGFHKPNPPEFYRELEQRGVDYIIVHGRMRNEYFSGKVDYNHIAMVRNTVSIEVVANGGIDSTEKLKEVKTITGCRYFMIGQAALENPPVFRCLNNGEECTKNYLEILRIMHTHFNLMCRRYKDKAHVLFRKYFHRYIKGLRNAKRFNNMVNSCRNNDCVFNLLMKLKEEL